MEHEITNFHSHTGYSFLDGAGSCADIVARCKELGMKYVCISDHGTCAGHIDFWNECEKQGVIPVLGTELYTVDDSGYESGKPKGFHLCVWALNEEGLHNIWAISSNTYYRTGDGHRTPNTSWEDMKGHGKGVACSTACLGGAVATAALADDEQMALYFMRRYEQIFDKVYIEIHTNSQPEQHEANLWLVEFAHKHGYPLVYATDAHYVSKEDGDFHDVWLGCQVKGFYDIEHWTMDHEYYIQGEDDIRERLAYLGKEAVEECFSGVDEFLSSVEKIDIDSTHKLPKFPLPEGWDDAGEYLRYLTYKGLLSRVGHLNVLEGDSHNTLQYQLTDETPENVVEVLEPYMKQLSEVELPIIVDNGLSDYFLIVADYCNWAKQTMLVGPGRGSAAASILCYCLGITEFDPMGKGLFFSRFLNEGRLGSLPDIDLDFEDFLKGTVHQYLSERYGNDKVTAVGTIAYFGIKSALKEVCRYYRVPTPDANKMTSIMGSLEEMSGDGNWRDSVSLLPPEQQRFLHDYEQQFPDLFKYAERMVGLPRQAGKHAAGYVISPTPLASVLPVRKSSSDDIISQFDKVAVEDMGFLKADILGLRNLTTLSLAARCAEERSGKHIDFYSLKEDPDDEAVWKQFVEGDTLGLFQLEGEGITDVCKKLKPRSINDISVILALYRPGVIGAGMLDKYISRAVGAHEVEYLCPQLEPILKDTFGIIVYQEQAMRIFSDLAGFTDEEADQIRAAIGKKHMDKILKNKPKFLQGCQDNGILSDVAEAIFEQIEASGNYSFNKAHSYAYATITFWTAWMKAHYPIEFYAASMTTVGAHKSPLYISEAKRKGIDVVPPVLSTVSRDYVILSSNQIAFGLVNVKGAGPKAIDKIIENAPYEGYNDFCERAGVNKTVKKALINCGFFREENENRRDMFMRLTEAHPQEETYEDYSVADIVKLETSILGLPLSVNPFTGYKQQLGENICAQLSYGRDVENLEVGGMCDMLVRLTEVKPHKSKKGLMAFISFINELDEEFEATMFSDIYGVVSQWLVDGAMLFIRLQKGEWKGRTSWTVSALKHLS